MNCGRTAGACPNTPPCEHDSFLHDVHDLDDPCPTCCAEGCRCGHPGTAELVRHDDGTVTVRSADHLILVAQVLLDPKMGAEPWFNQGDGVIQLDTAGEYRYRYLRPHNPQLKVDVYERITP